MKKNFLLSFLTICGVALATILTTTINYKPKTLQTKAVDETYQTLNVGTYKFIKNISQFPTDCAITFDRDPVDPLEITENIGYYQIEKIYLQDKTTGNITPLDTSSVEDINWINFRMSMLSASTTITFWANWYADPYQNELHMANLDGVAKQWTLGEIPTDNIDLITILSVKKAMRLYNGSGTRMFHNTWITSNTNIEQWFIPFTLNIVQGTYELTIPISTDTLNINIVKNTREPKANFKIHYVGTTNTIHDWTETESNFLNVNFNYTTARVNEVTWTDNNTEYEYTNIRQDRLTKLRLKIEIFTIGNVNNYDARFLNYVTSYYPPERPTPEIGTEVIDLGGLMLQILGMPFSFISTAFNVTIFPNTQYEINFARLFKGILAILTILFIIKLFTSGLGVLGNYTNNASDRKWTKEQRKMQKESHQWAKEKHDKEMKE